MKILGIHADCCHLGGHTRLFLVMMDIFKSLGYEIHIVSRTSDECTAKVEMPLTDPQSAKPLFTEVEVKTTMKLKHHDISDIKKFQPLRHVTPDDITLHDIPVVYWGNRFLTPWSPEVIQMIEDADYIFGDTEMYVRMESDLDIAHKHIQFVHFPTANLMPVTGKEPKHIWVNSNFTKQWIRIRWGYNNPNYIKIGQKYATVRIPKQIFNATVVNPPIYIDDYQNDSGFKDRNYDVVMFARLGEDKFTVAGYLDDHFKLLSMGALSPINPALLIPEQEAVKQVDLNMPTSKKEVFVPRGELRQNLTFKEVPKMLQKAKVYVHSKGFGLTQSGGVSEPEHFGITICEAMAAGCPAIVPRSGGCWTDISKYGKYTLAYSSLEELKTNIEVLVNNKEEWTKWHELALEGVQRFSAENVTAQVKQLLK